MATPIAELPESVGVETALWTSTRDGATLIIKQDDLSVKLMGTTTTSSLQSMASTPSMRTVELELFSKQSGTDPT